MKEDEELKKARRFPPSIDDSEIDSCIKEWKLSGIETRDRGCVLICGGHDGVVYQKIGDAWHLVDMPTIKTILTEILNEATTRTAGANAAFLGKLAAGAYKNEYSKIIKAPIVEDDRIK